MRLNVWTTKGKHGPSPKPQTNISAVLILTSSVSGTETAVTPARLNEQKSVLLSVIHLFAIKMGAANLPIKIATQSAGRAAASAASLLQLLIPTSAPA